MFSKRATKIDKIFTVDLTLCSKGQIDGEDFLNFHGLLRKYGVYQYKSWTQEAGAFTAERNSLLESIF